MELKWSQMEPTGAKPKQNQRKAMKKTGFSEQGVLPRGSLFVVPAPGPSVNLPARSLVRPAGHLSAGWPVCRSARLFGRLAGRPPFLLPPACRPIALQSVSLSCSCSRSLACSLSFSISLFLSISLHIYIYIYMYIYIYIYTHIYI